MFDQFTDLLLWSYGRGGDGGSVDMIYLDFAKAFNKVTHQRLLQL